MLLIALIWSAPGRTTMVLPMLSDHGLYVVLIFKIALQSLSNLFGTDLILQ